jgi:hypothetical protein
MGKKVGSMDLVHLSGGLLVKKKKVIKNQKLSRKKKINWQQGDNEFDRQDVNRGEI